MLQEQRHASINIKPDPRAAQYRQFLWIYVLNPICMLFFAFTQFAAHGFNFAALPLWDKFYCIFLLLFAVLMFVSISYQRRWFQRLEQRRQAAARGDTNLLADPQPVPDAHAVQLPFTINAVPRTPTTKSIMVFSLVFTLIIVLIVGIITGFIVSSYAGHSSVVHINILLLAAIIVCIPVIFVVLIVGLRHYMHKQKIIFTEHGLMHLGPSSQVHSIPWRDARLFARDAPPYGIVQINSSALPSTFQIASEDEVVQWLWIHSSKHYKPPFGLSQAEYNRQMQGLLSMIRARTGLLLYDLRKQSSAE